MTIHYSIHTISKLICNMVQYSKEQYSTVQCSTVQCSTVQCTIVMYSIYSKIPTQYNKTGSERGFEKISCITVIHNSTLNNTSVTESCKSKYQRIWDMESTTRVPFPPFKGETN